METAKLKKYAQFARRSILGQVSAKLELVLAENSAARRENHEGVKKLKEAIEENGKEQVVDRVAYTWFNRFCALRFMDVNRYNRVRIVSPADPSQFQPEILAEAKMGHLDDEMVNDRIRGQVNALLAGQTPSRDPQAEAYRLLLVAACNFWNKDMPFLFQRINDYTELLMPDDLLSGNSILAYTREAMTPDVCQDVEVIGWLYQFYISEKKDEVFEGLKKNIKITPENIPAATQLFTPHWIVRYLVENSLGRLWMLNRPISRLIGQMDYYIKPEQAETDFLRINKPEEIKICDPACGSGHMLTYAFDLLYAIYEEEGYEPAEIPEKILTHNLFGIEIDERAGELAAFALTMKARARQRLFFKKNIRPNICVLENIHFEEQDLQDYIDFIGRDLFILPLQTTLRQFEEADNFGSLICPDVTDVAAMLKILEFKDVSGQLFLSPTHQKVMKALQQADYLSRKYHVVIANPPYMGSGGMNARLAKWAKDNYQLSKTDYFAMFIERGLDLLLCNGYSAMVTMQSWMYLQSFEKLRNLLLSKTSIEGLLHMGNMVMGIAFGTSATVWKKNSNTEKLGAFTYVDYDDLSKSGCPEIFPPKNARNNKGGKSRFFWVSSKDFSLIPSSPISYWISDKVRSVFRNEKLSSVVESGGRCKTTNDELYLRKIWEVSNYKFGVNERWCTLYKGGNFRKYYGNRDHVVRWDKLAKEFYSMVGGLTQSRFWNREGITWTIVSAKDTTAFRIKSNDGQYNSVSPTVFSLNEEIFDNLFLVSLLNSAVSKELFAILNPTLALNVGDVLSLPYVKMGHTKIRSNAKSIINQHRVDWDSYETSLNFNSPPLLNPDHRQLTLKATFQKLRTHWQEMTLEIQRLEEENNCIFIDAYGLQDELTPDVPLEEITLTCNPHYRYGSAKSEDELEALLLADTMREFVSYAVGCMFGRYSLDKPGLILANQGETLEDYLKQIPQPSFPVDDDNVIPILDGSWFADDISERFKQFLKLTFGSENYQENLRFIEQALNVKGRRDYSIRDYFLNEFYSDHVRRYKKRPIYWLFTSPKGSFNALIYLHRYRPDTVSVVLNKYLREFRSKLTAHKAHLESISISEKVGTAEKTKALKEIERVVKMIAEIDEYEREVLYPLATQRLEIDLDDGVKVNYLKFGGALKKIVGLESKEE